VPGSVLFQLQAGFRQAIADGLVSDTPVANPMTTLAVPPPASAPVAPNMLPNNVIGVPARSDRPVRAAATNR
jgi:hypothetical protein